MSFEIVRDSLVEFQPSLAREVAWDDVNAALVICFQQRNLGDIHIDVRGRLSLNPGSNKTHIDITSGHDIPEGLSPVTDFFDFQDGKRITYAARLNRVNLLQLGSTDAIPETTTWVSKNFHVKFFMRNANNNPSAQLTENDDLLPLRHNLGPDQSMVFLRYYDNSFDVLGLPTSPSIAAIMGRKTKRMFINLAFQIENGHDIPVELPPDLEGQDLGRPHTTQRMARGQGRFLDPAIQAAVENRGMELCRAYLERKGYTVEDVHTPDRAVAAGLVPYPGYDQLASGADEPLSVCPGTK